LVLLLGRVFTQGYTTFIDYRMSVPVFIDPARVSASDPTGANYDQMVAEAVMARLSLKDDELGETSSKFRELMSNDLGFQLLKQVREDTSLIGKTITVSGPVGADAS